MKTLLLPPEENDLEKITEQNFPEVQLGVSPYDMVHLDTSDLKNIERLVIEERKSHNNTVVFVDNIHKTKATKLVWEQLKNNEKVTVTIDLFYCGIAFFRKEQAKEHFKIRI